jgi:2-polyprenyl-6-methoxyphenol hydroxylase-like FAD-dependent oxidoreductase
MATEQITTDCAIAGGGPAGMMLGFLLARAGVDVMVMEKYPDFFRDFRGDTIHPSTLDVMYELGLLDAFLKLPHQNVREIGAIFGNQKIVVADFTHLPTHCGFIAFIPQWDFLNFLAERGKRYPGFHVRMNTEADGLLMDGDRITGVQAKTPEGLLEIRASLVVGADGRHSTLRALAELKVEDFGAPMDVLWFRLSQRAGDGSETLGRFEAGHIFIMLNRGDYWQCAFVIPKGGFEALQAQGIDTFRKEIVALNPVLADRVGEIASWDDVKLLTVRVDRLKRWYRPGLLCIGDAAHAMSPIGGVGINLAVQDAVAAANILWEPLREGRVAEDVLAKVQARRQWPVEMTQAFQLFVQKRVISNVLGMTAQPRPPFIATLFNRFPVLRRIPARLIGMGFRPEHVQTPDMPPAG